MARPTPKEVPCGNDSPLELNLNRRGLPRSSNGVPSGPRTSTQYPRLSEGVRSRSGFPILPKSRREFPRSLQNSGSSVFKSSDIIFKTRSPRYQMRTAIRNGGIDRANTLDQNLKHSEVYSALFHFTADIEWCLKSLKSDGPRRLPTRRERSSFRSQRKITQNDTISKRSGDIEDIFLLEDIIYRKTIYI